MKLAERVTAQRIAASAVAAELGHCQQQVSLVQASSDDLLSS